LASAAIEATRLITGIGNGNLAERLLKTEWTLARDTRSAIPKGHLTGAAILATSMDRQAGIPMFTVIANVTCIATTREGKIQRYKYLVREEMHV